MSDRRDSKDDAEVTWAAAVLAAMARGDSGPPKPEAEDDEVEIDTNMPAAGGETASGSPKVQEESSEESLERNEEDGNAEEVAGSIQQGDGDGEPAVPDENVEEDPDQAEDGEESGDEDDATHQAGNAGGATNTAGGSGSAPDPSLDANGVLLAGSNGWRRNAAPGSNPPQYHVPSDAQGGTRIAFIARPVNFANNGERLLANKERRRVMGRARKRYGIPPLQAHTNNPNNQYTPANRAWIAAEYDRYANEPGHVGLRMTGRELHQRYNAAHPNHPRSEQSLNSLVNRSPAIRARRDLYTRQR